jgi:hypothetical protein
VNTASSALSAVPAIPALGPRIVTYSTLNSAPAYVPAANFKIVPGVAAANFSANVSE